MIRAQTINAGQFTIEFVGGAEGQQTILNVRGRTEGQRITFTPDGQVRTIEAIKVEAAEPYRNNPLAPAGSNEVALNEAADRENHNVQAVDKAASPK